MYSAFPSLPEELFCRYRQHDTEDVLLAHSHRAQHAPNADGCHPEGNPRLGVDY